MGIDNNPLDLDALQGLYEASTPGPWHRNMEYMEGDVASDSFRVDEDGDHTGILFQVNRGTDRWNVNADFIDAAHNNWEALLELARRGRADTQRIEWLEKNVPTGNFKYLIDTGKVEKMQDTVRGAVDAAMRATERGEGEG